MSQYMALHQILLEKTLQNPIAAILSTAMMLRYSFKLNKEADAIEKAVTSVLEAGYRTVDIMSEDMKAVGTIQMGKLICDAIQ